MIIAIAAIGMNNELGKDNQLIWHLPNDFKRFKTLTTGHYIIMGRKTFESFPKPLPNRTHVIITRQKNYTAENCIVVDSLKKAIAICPKDEDVYVIGGGEIYQQAMPYADKIELTRVHERFDGDAFFPKIDPSVWTETENISHQKDEHHKYSFSFITYQRR